MDKQNLVCPVVRRNEAVAHASKELTLETLYNMKEVRHVRTHIYNSLTGNVLKRRIWRDTKQTGNYWWRAVGHEMGTWCLKVIRFLSGAVSLVSVTLVRTFQGKEACSCSWELPTAHQYMQGPWLCPIWWGSTWWPPFLTTCSLEN